MAQNMSIKDLCRRHTSLNNDDIDKLGTIADHLPVMADLHQADIFIDCSVSGDDQAVVVVAESKPTNTKSLYNHPVVGRYAYEPFEPAVFFAMRTGEQTFQNRAYTQEGKVAEQSVVPIVDGNGGVIALLISEKDISEQAQEEGKMKALSEAATTLGETMIRMTQNKPFVPEVIEEALFYIGSNNEIRYFNPSANQLVYEVSGDACHANTSIVDYLPFMREVLNLPESLLVKEVEVNNKYLQVKKIALHPNGTFEGTLIIVQDFTELKDKENELIMKSVAIREIHHRVKNNLQTIASLIRLQMKNDLPVASKPYFQETLHRILSISSVYEVILAESSTDNVDVYTLIKKVGDMIVYTEKSDYRSISIYYHGETFQLPSDKAVSIALVINELVQNCVKHAFYGQINGTIEIRLQNNGNDIILEVLDNGVGYSGDVESFGLNIVKMLVEYDLDGTFSINQRSQGTVAAVTFKQGEEDDLVEKTHHGS